MASFSANATDPQTDTISRSLPRLRDTENKPSLPQSNDVLNQRLDDPQTGVGMPIIRDERHTTRRDVHLAEPSRGEEEEAGEALWDMNAVHKDS